MPNTLPEADRTRLARERRELRKALNGLGITDFKVSTTGHQSGHVVAWTSLPSEEVSVAMRGQLADAGFVVRPHTYTVAILTGEVA